MAKKIELVSDEIGQAADEFFQRLAELQEQSITTKNRRKPVDLSDGEDRGYSSRDNNYDNGVNR